MPKKVKPTAWEKFSKNYKSTSIDIVAQMKKATKKLKMTPALNSDGLVVYVCSSIKKGNSKCRKKKK